MQEVEIPRPAVPDPFSASLEGVVPEPSSLPPPPPVSPLDQPVEEVVRTQQPQLASPFDAPEPPTQQPPGNLFLMSLYTLHTTLLCMPGREAPLLSVWLSCPTQHGSH